MEHKPTIGLEIHIELATKSKMFCDCWNNSDETHPNVNVCPVCMAHPGTLPVINKEAVKKTLKTALALNCKIERQSFFERKNYFYPDLPKGYQISQYQVPLSKKGFLNLPPHQTDTERQSRPIGQNPISVWCGGLAGGKKIRIERIHLEEDTGKLIHPPKKDYSLVDFNRAGVPLMELVTEPDIESSREAGEFIRLLQLILRYLGVSGANMEKGEMRAEVNISLRDSNSKLGTKVEIKNLNSIKAVEKAIEYEIKRQGKILDDGDKIVQETRGWHDKKEITFSQREKEEAHDYRYFPEPDLPPLKISEKFLKEIKSEIPELPSKRKERFHQEYQLSEKEIGLFVSHKDLGEYFEKVVSELRDWVKTKKPEIEKNEKEFQRLIKLTSNYIASDLQSLLKEAAVSPTDLSEAKDKEGSVIPGEGEDFLISPENFAEFLSMIYTGEISSKIAKTVLKEMFGTSKDPSQIIEEKGLQQITDKGEIERVIQEVIEKNPKPVEDYKKGKETALQFLVGQVMAQTKGKANPQTVNEILKKLL